MTFRRIGALLPLPLVATGCKDDGGPPRTADNTVTLSAESAADRGEKLVFLLARLPGFEALEELQRLRLALPLAHGRPRQLGGRGHEPRRLVGPAALPGGGRYARRPECAPRHAAGPGRDRRVQGKRRGAAVHGLRVHVRPVVDCAVSTLC